MDITFALIVFGIIATVASLSFLLGREFGRRSAFRQVFDRQVRSHGRQK